MLEEAGPETILPHALVVRRPQRRAGWATRLMEALSATYAGRGWYVPAIVPEGSASAYLEGTGWERERFNQTEMHVRLASFGSEGVGS